MRVLLRFWLLPLLGVTLAACGGAHDATEKQLAELRSEVVKLRADNAVLAERLDGIELRSGAGLRGSAPASVTDAAPALDRPDLDVVRLVPEGGAADDPDADTPRPVVRGSGKAGTIEDPSGGKPPAAPPSAGSGPAKSTPKKAVVR